jgi:hypothetical protein
MRVYLVILKCVKVENDPLQIDNEYIWWLRDKLSSLNIDLLFAVIALEVINNSALDHFSQTVIQSPPVLDLHTEVVVAFEVVGETPAVGALVL